MRSLIEQSIDLLDSCAPRGQVTTETFCRAAEKQHAGVKPLVVVVWLTMFGRKAKREKKTKKRTRKTKKKNELRKGKN